MCPNLENGMNPLIRTNGQRFYSTLYYNFRQLYSRLKYWYSVISVIVDSLPGNIKNRVIDLFVASGVQYFRSWVDCWSGPQLPKQLGFGRSKLPGQVISNRAGNFEPGRLAFLCVFFTHRHVYVLETKMCITNISLEDLCVVQ